MIRMLTALPTGPLVLALIVMAFWTTLFLVIAWTYLEHWSRVRKVRRMGVYRK